MSLMRDEAIESAAVVERQLKANHATSAALAARWKAAPPRFIMTLARGSSDHAATFAKYLIERTCGRVVASAAPSLSSLYDARLALKNSAVLAISQSGQSADLLAFAQDARAAGAEVIAVVNDVASPLAKLADVVLPLHAGPEHSVAATKSYIASLSAVLQLTAHWSGDSALKTGLDALPDALARAAVDAPEELVERLAKARSMFTLGRASAFGIAGEAALKLKETCTIHAEAYSTAEVLHGPMAIVGDGFPIIAFLQNDRSVSTTRETLQKLEDAGARITTFGAAELNADVPVAASGPGLFALPPAILRFYLLAEAVARAKGLNPDAPRNLRKVTISR